MEVIKEFEERAKEVGLIVNARKTEYIMYLTGDKDNTRRTLKDL